MKPHFKKVTDKRYGSKWRCYGKTKQGGDLEGVGRTWHEAYSDYQFQRRHFA